MPEHVILRHPEHHRTLACRCGRTATTEDIDKARHELALHIIERTVS